MKGTNTMKDYLHLFGGMIVAILLLAVYIFAWGCIQSCYGETIKQVAPDGVNEIVYEVDADGNVSHERTTLAYVAPKVSVYRLELHSTDSGETAWLVGQDGVKRPVVLVTPDEYKMLTERLDLVWAYFNSTRDGRVKLHGKVTHTIIDDAALEKVETHSDGYTHREKIPPKVDRPRVDLGIKAARGVPQPMPTGISDRQFEMRKKLRERASHPVKTVTVEHDAAIGKDKVIE